MTSFLLSCTYHDIKCMFIISTLMYIFFVFLFYFTERLELLWWSGFGGKYLHKNRGRFKFIMKSYLRYLELWQVKREWGRPSNESAMFLRHRQLSLKISSRIFLLSVLLTSLKISWKCCPSVSPDVCLSVCVNALFIIVNQTHYFKQHMPPRCSRKSWL